MAKVIDAILRLKDEFSSTLKRADMDFQKMQTNASKMGTEFYRTSKGLGNAAKVFMPLTATATAAGVASVKAYGEFDTAMKGVAKTTDMTDAEFSKLEKNIVKMTREIPASAKEIANTAEVAGQLGVQNENIESFTKTMVMMGTATNMSSTEAANGMARMANITQMSEKDYERLGSTIVDLGNNLATSESEIMAMSLRLSATGKQVGLTEHGIVGLAGALSSLGIEAEAGGTAMSQVMTKINKSVSMGGEKLEQFAQVAGTSAETFAQVWKSDPEQAMVMLVNGLGQAQASGQNLDEVLTDLGITGIRETDTMKRLAGSGDLLEQSFGRAGKAWQDNVALSNEAKAAYDSFENSIQFMKNALFEAGQVAAEHVLPVLQPIIEKITEMAKTFAEATPEQQKFVLKLIAIAAAIGPFLLGLSKISFGITKVYDGFKTWSTGMKAGKGILGSLLTPGGKFVAIALAIAAAAAVIWLNWDKITGVFNTVKETFSNVGESISNTRDKIKEWFEGLDEKTQEFNKSFIDGIKNLPEKAGEFSSNLKDRLTEGVTNAAQAFSTFGSTVMGYLEENFPGIAALVKTWIDGIGIQIRTIITIGKHVFGIFADIISGNWQGAWDHAKNIVKVAIDYVTAMWNNLKSLLSQILKPVIDMVYDKFKKGYEWVKDKWNSLKAFLRHPIKGIVNIASKVAGSFGHNARGTDNWKGGPTWVGEEGPELLNLPRGSRVTTATKSSQIARQAEKSSTGDIYFTLPKLADKIIVREEADIDRIVEKMTKKFRLVKANQVTV